MISRNRTISLSQAGRLRPGELQIFHPEDHARTQIDASLAAAGWIVQSRAQMNLGTGLGVAVRGVTETLKQVSQTLERQRGMICTPLRKNLPRSAFEKIEFGLHGD